MCCLHKTPYGAAPTKVLGGWLTQPWETLLLWNSKERSAVSTRRLTSQHPYKYQGDIIANSTPYAHLPTDAPTRSRIHFFGSRLTRFIRDPSHHIKTPTWNFYKEIYKQKWYRNRLLIALPEESHEEYLKRLCKQTLLWLVVMSRSLRNSEEQDDRKKRDVEQSALTHAHHTHCASRQLGTTADRSMPFLGTDLKKHAIWQGSVEEPAAKNFVARKVRTIE